MPVWISDIGLGRNQLALDSHHLEDGRTQRAIFSTKFRTRMASLSVNGWNGFELVRDVDVE
jgi:hypothetical protein